MEVLKLSHGDTFMAGWEEGEAERVRFQEALEDAATEVYTYCTGCERVAEITYKALGWGDPAHVEARKELRGSE